jgi:hypothetical protein
MPLRINWTRVPNGASIAPVGSLNLIDLMTSAGTPSLRLMRRPLERTVTFAGHRQDTDLANPLAKAGVESQVISERNIHLGQLWLV